MIGENKGAYTLHNHKISSYYEADDVTGFKQDDFGNYWMSTFNNGLFKLKNSLKKSTLIPFKNGLLVDKLLPQSDHTYLLNTSNGDLINFNANSQNYKLMVKNENVSITKSSLEKTSDFNFCFINYKNIVTASASSNQIITRQMSKEMNTRKWKVLENKNHIILVAKNEVLLFSKNIKTIAEDSVYYPYRNIPALINDACNYNTDTTLLATDEGLLYFVSKDDSKALKPLNHYFTNIKSISNFYVLKHKIYFRTDNTLYKFISFSEAPKLVFTFPENDITPIEIYSDDEKTFYYLTHKNLQIIDVENNKAKSINIPLTYAEKLRGLFIHKDTLALYSSINLYQIPKANLLDFDCKIKVSTRQILLKNNLLHYTIDTNISIKYQIKLDAKILLQVTNIEKNENDSLMYLIANNDGDTIAKKIILNNEILLDHLQPDQYSIIIYYKNNILKTYIVNILPKWYQTFLAKLLIIFGVLAAFVFGTTAIVRQRNNKYNKQLLSQIYTQDLEHISSLNQLEPHFIFNALEPLRNYILKNQQPESLDYLNNFSVLLRTMMELSRQKWVSIERESSFIDKYLQIQNIKLGNKIDFEIRTAGLENINQKIPAMIVQPFVENAIKYGGTNKENRIIICFEKQDAEIIIKIIDSGKGFEYENDFIKKDHAIYIIKERLRMMSEHKTEKTKLQFLKETNNFSVIISLPISNLPNN
jgi:sensor histidine kinase YesM